MDVNLEDQITLLQLDDGQAATGVPLGQLAQECDCLSSESCENFWLPVEEFVNQSSSNSLLQRWVGHAATQLKRNKATPLDCALLSGVEYWVQKYENGRGLGFHFDKDEHALTSTGTMQHPIMSVVVYLSGSHTDPRQAPTVVLNQQFDQELKRAQPDDPVSCAVVFPKAGNVLAFDGSLGHGVLESNRNKTRMTLLINFWNHRPQNIQQLTTSRAAELGLQTCGSHVTFSTKLTRQDSDEMKIITLPPAGDVPVNVDELLHDHDVILQGDGARDAVILHHAGYTLYPAAEQMADEQCAAYLVPTTLLPGSSSSDGD